MKFWSNLAMIALIVPLGLIINGLRIALIGMVGDYNGKEAANTFHDWSGWITLVICFIILSRIARILGWQD
jgi:exosortase/archaeosortase family protein